MQSSLAASIVGALLVVVKFPNLGSLKNIYSILFFNQGMHVQKKL